MSRLNDLLRQLRTEHEPLAKDIEREVQALADRQAFGLNFERHVPEAVELPGRRVRKGDKARVLPSRGETRRTTNEKLWHVTAIDRSRGSAVATLEGVDGTGSVRRAVEDLVVVAEFRDPIYPGLISTGKVERGGDKPFHAVINAENYHALQTLLFTHRAQVDCIYIDPPYNTGARDWKYNNDYVEGDDLYRHSKWLAFIERRILLAKELLNPANSVLIVTIDEKEVHRLGLLLDQIFPGESRQLVTIVINRNGSARAQEMSRVEEYAFFLFLGDAGPSMVTQDLLGSEAETEKPAEVRWERLIRGGANSRRQDRPNLFYPVFVDPEERRLIEVGEPLPLGASRHEVPARANLVTVWPLKTNGEEGRWRASAEYVRALLADGYARTGSYDSRADRWSLLYLGKAQIRRIQSGDITVVGKREDGSALLIEAVAARRAPKTVWNKPSHAAGENGSNLLKRFVPGRTFPFPKSLYAVEDSLRIAVADKKDAVIVDFFAGSGTTTHAVMRLNRQDDGRRRSISVTNNEVSTEEQATLRNLGSRPGDADWETLGICDYITKPRLAAAITGITPNGDPVSGDYRFTDEFPMADGFQENLESFTLTYESPLRVASNREFSKIAPLLWLRAGARGGRIEDLTTGWGIADAYGVLADLDDTEDFLKAVAANEGVRIVYIVTDEDRLFESVSQEMPDHIETVRLYESYLRNFEIESGRSSQ